MFSAVGMELAEGEFFTQADVEQSNPWRLYPKPYRSAVPRESELENGFRQDPSENESLQ